MFKCYRLILSDSVIKTSSGITVEALQAVVQNNPRLQQIPIIGGLDFGHTNPRLTLPIGGTVTISAHLGDVQVIIEKH